ncbi:MAG: Catalase, partial [Solirubrobacterales bacterium]|nr:Catalase [Solirubrobacterales bacterium]
MAYATSRVSGPATDWREDVAADEAERFERHAETLRDYQRRNDRRGAQGRALHRKAHGGVEAELEVRDGLPPEARAGLFAAPGRYRAYVRFSNGLGMHQPDWMPDVRGLAVKVLGVPGRKLIPGLEDATTQDFLLITTPSLPFSNVDDFIAFVRAAESQATLLPRIVRAFGPARAARLLRFLVGLRPPESLAAVPYFSALPLRWGDHAGKVALFPVDAPAPTGRRRGR